MFAREQRPKAASRPAPRRAREAMPSAEPRAQRVPERSVCPCGGGCPRCAGRQSKAGSVLSAREDQIRNETLVPGVVAADVPQPSFVREAMRSAGEPLAPGIREHFERRFGAPLHNVRVHAGPAVRAASVALRAQAFAVGEKIGWPESAPHMSSVAGQRLLAHELAHVMQQRTGSRAGMEAGSPAAEAEARAFAHGSLPHPVMRLTPTRPGLALSVDEFIGKSPLLSTRSYSQLIEDVDQITEWLSRQTTSTPESAQLEDALVRLRAEIARRNRNIAAKVVRPPRHGRGKAAPQEAPLTGVASTDERPRILIDRGSPVYGDAADRREQVDKIVAWLQRTDVSRSDRALLRDELRNLAPEFEKDREKAAGERQARVIQQAIAMPANGDKTKLLSALQRIDSIRPLGGHPGLQFLMKGTEMIVISDEAVTKLRSQTISALDDAADKARSMNEYTFGRANDFVKVNQDHVIVGFIVTKWSGKDPFDMWNEVLPLIQHSNMDVTAYRNMRKGANASLSNEAAKILDALDKAGEARKIFNETFDGAMNAADSIVNGLKVVRDVSLAVELALTAAVAAPVVAAGVGGLGFTGATAGGLTMLGTGGVVGLTGAGLGGGSTLLSGGSMKEAKADAWKWGKRGFATGLGAGTTQVLGSTLEVGSTSLTTGSRLLRVAASQAGGNVVGNVTGTALEGGDAKQMAISGLAGLGTGIVAAPLGMASNSISNPFLRTTANMATAGGIGFGSTYILTGKTDEAWKSAVTGGATAGLLSIATDPNATPGQPTWGQKKAFALGGRLTYTTRAYLSAAMLGMSNPNLPFRGTGATVGGLWEPQFTSIYSSEGSPASVVAPAQQNTPPPVIHEETPAVATSAAVDVVPAPAQAAPAVNSAPPAAAAVQAVDAVTASAAAAGQSVAGAHPIDPALAADVDRAFAEDAQYQTSDPRGFQMRGRTTRSGTRQLSMSRIVLTRAQQQAASQLVGKRLSGDYLTAWNNTANAREAQDMVEVNRLWNLGTPQAQQQARDLARAVFDRHVSRFWRAVRRNNTLRGGFQAAGTSFTLTASGAPRYELPNGEQVGMTLDHNTRLMDNPTLALTGTNLSVVPDDENSVTLEDIRNNDPFQR